MKIDAENFERLAADAKLKQGSWGDGRETACLMSAIAGRSIEDCVAAGWPKWLVETGTWVFDSSTRLVSDSRAFIAAAQAFNARGGDPGRLFRDWRLQSVLPEAMGAIGPGDEPWRAHCRAVVQWCLDNDGRAAGAAEVAEAAEAARVAWVAWAAEAAEAAEAAWAARVAWAAWAARATRAAGAAWAAGAAEAAEAAWAAEAAEAAGAARAAEAACRGRMIAVLYRLMRGDETAERIAAAIRKGNSHE